MVGVEHEKLSTGGRPSVKALEEKAETMRAAVGLVLIFLLSYVDPIIGAITGWW